MKHARIRQHTFIRTLALIGVVFSLLIPAFSASAVAPDPPHFERTWARTDRPVAEGAAIRTWLWGQDANTEVLTEDYRESPGGIREIQYFDKSRMEITNPNGDPNSIWFVTNGLLVVELTSGRMQTGENSFVNQKPAVVNVAGDPNDPDGPTYVTIASVLNQPAAAEGSLVTQVIDRAGNITDNPSLSNQNVIAGRFVPETNHTVAQPFWEFMNSSGTVWVDGQFQTQNLFENAFFATGFPISEAYWATVRVGGEAKFVLLQCFERRCLTYTPSNSAEWRVEAGNVGRHYYTWRYEHSGEVVTKRVSASSGGSVSLGSGAAVEFPPGALSEDTDVTIRSVDEQQVPQSPLGSGTAGQGIDVDIGNAQLSQAATLRVPYRSGSVTSEEENRLALLHYNDTTKMWEPQPMMLDKSSSRMVAEVNTFSLYAPFVMPADDQAGVPAAPSNLGAASTGQDSIQLTWQDNSSDEDSFDVQYSEDNGSTWAHVGTASANVTTYNISGFSAGTHYCFRVSATNNNGSSGWSNTACATTDGGGSIPAAPSGLFASQYNETTAELTWSDNSNNETAFNVYMEMDFAERQFVGLVDCNGTQPCELGYVINLVPTSHYCFYVTAYNDYGESGFSNSACLTIEQNGTIPNAPTGLEASAYDSATVDLYWIDHSDNEDGFNFYMEEDYGSISYVGSVSCGSDQPCEYAQIINLLSSTHYCFYVSAYNTVGESILSNAACLTTPGFAGVDQQGNTSAIVTTGSD